jgi:hypothetical protein
MLNHEGRGHGFCNPNPWPVEFGTSAVWFSIYSSISYLSGMQNLTRVLCTKVQN